MTTITNMADLVHAVNLVLDHVWEAEEEDYHKTKGNRADHIYPVLLVLDKFVNSD
jgi:hypothetical protein